MIKTNKISGNARSNLLRRISRHNANNPTLQVSKPVGNTKKEFNTVMRQLAKAQATAKFIRQRDKVVSESLANGLTVNPKSIRGVKTLQQAKNRLKLTKQFNIAQKKYVERVTAYNNAVHNGELNKDGDKFHILPRTRKELAAANRLLTKLEKGRVKEVREALHVEDKMRLSTHTIRKDLYEARRQDAPTLQEFKYYQTAIREVQNSPYPQLGELFKIIGWKGVNELSRFDFTISDFAESQLDTEDYNEEYVYDTLMVIAQNLPPRLKEQVISFLKDN